MNSKISLKWSLYIISTVGILLSSLVFFSIAIVQTLQSLVPPQSLASVYGIIFGERISLDLPIRLNIPKIGVDAHLEHVGLTPEGAVGTPKDPGNAAWFDLGPRPGDKGNAIIDGHYGWKDGIPAVFDDLYQLRKGDKLYIEDGKGTISVFVVRELKIYGENENVSQVFTSSDGKAHLNLITCEGVWNKVRKSYSNRLVVFSDKEM